MGGMIAQAMAVANPARVRSLNLIYTTPSFDVDYFIQNDGAPEPMELAVPHERAVALEKFIERERFSASTDFAYDVKWVRELARRCTTAATRRPD